MSPVSLPAGAGRKYVQNLVLKQGTRANDQLTLSPTQPGKTGFYPVLCSWVSSWHYLRSLNLDFYGHSLTFWVFLMHKLHVWPQGPICHLQWSHQHQLQECDNRYSGAQPPWPLLSSLGWEGENCSRVLSDFQIAKENLITTCTALPQLLELIPWKIFEKIVNSASEHTLNSVHSPTPSNKNQSHL